MKSFWWCFNVTHHLRLSSREKPQIALGVCWNSLKQPTIYLCLLFKQEEVWVYEWIASWFTCTHILFIVYGNMLIWFIIGLKKCFLLIFLIWPEHNPMTTILHYSYLYSHMAGLLPLLCLLSLVWILWHQWLCSLLMLTANE